MNETNLVSVVIPVYNVSQYLEEAMASIQNQTYSNLEIICVDDCSEDDSLQTLHRLAKKDNRIQIFRNKINLGISATLNKAINNSKGKIIVRMDADDVSFLDRVERQISFLKGGDFDFVGSPVLYITEDGKEIGCSSFYTPDQLVRFLRYKSTLGHPTWMLYKSIYDELGAYRDVAPAEDYDFLLRAVNAGVKIGMTEKPLLKFRTQSRTGGTALTQGLVQRKMFNYVRRLSQDRAVYSERDINDVKLGSIIGKKLFHISQLLYYRATYNKHKKNYLVAGVFLFLSMLISPYQFQFVYRAVILKLLILAYRK